jgi:hypothetical protein
LGEQNVPQWKQSMDILKWILNKQDTMLWNGLYLRVDHNDSLFWTRWRNSGMHKKYVNYFLSA